VLARDNVSGLARRLPDAIDTIVICGGPAESCKQYLGPLDSKVLRVIDNTRRIAAVWRVSSTPFALITDHNGRVLKKINALSEEGLNGLVGALPDHQHNSNHVSDIVTATIRELTV
jgi:hypothetical protein